MCDNDNFADIVGIINIFVECNTEYTLTLKDVWHVLNMRLNVISIHVLEE